MEYKGYHIMESGDRGGKAGRGRGKTRSVQVREPLRPGEYLLKKQFSYPVDSFMKYLAATEKAKKFIDQLCEQKPLRSSKSS